MTSPGGSFSPGASRTSDPAWTGADLPQARRRPRHTATRRTNAHGSAAARSTWGTGAVWAVPALGYLLSWTPAPAIAATMTTPFPPSAAEQLEGPDRWCLLSTSMANGSPFARLETAALTTTG